MASDHVVLDGEMITGRGRSVNPFLLLEDAAGFIDFATEVFAAVEFEPARTSTPEGLLIHAELQLGDAWVLLADRLEGWPLHPGLLQIWVADVQQVIDRAVGRGATVVTPPTPFYGEVTLARVADPWQNLWWLYAPAPGQPDPQPAWEGESDVVFRTVDEHLRSRIS